MRGFFYRRNRVAHRHQRENVSARLNVEEDAQRLRQNLGRRRRSDRLIDRVDDGILTVGFARQDVREARFADRLFKVVKLDHARRLFDELLLEHTHDSFVRATTVGIGAEHLCIQFQHSISSNRFDVQDYKVGRRRYQEIFDRAKGFTAICR